MKKQFGTLYVFEVNCPSCALPFRDSADIDEPNVYLDCPHCHHSDFESKRTEWQSEAMLVIDLHTFERVELHTTVPEKISEDVFVRKFITKEIKMSRLKNKKRLDLLLKEIKNYNQKVTVMYDDLDLEFTTSSPDKVLEIMNWK